MVEVVAAGLGERKDLRRATTSAGAVDTWLPSLDGAVLEQVVQVAADRGGSQVELLREGRGGARAELEEGSSHALPSGSVRAEAVAVEFHNIIVSLLPDGFK
jgi:hypothetical protein